MEHRKGLVRLVVRISSLCIGFVVYGGAIDLNLTLIRIGFVLECGGFGLLFVELMQGEVVLKQDLALAL